MKVFGICEKCNATIWKESKELKENDFYQIDCIMCNEGYFESFFDKEYNQKLSNQVTKELKC